MKHSQAVQLMLTGTPVVLVEYRNLKKDKQRYRDKKTGSMVERDVSKHLCEFQGGAGSLEVMQWLEDGQTPESIPAIAKKGEMVFFIIKELTQEGYGAAYTGTGTFEKVTPEDEIPMGDASKTTQKVK